MVILIHSEPPEGLRAVGVKKIVRHVVKKTDHGILSLNCKKLLEYLRVADWRIRQVVLELTE